MPKILLLDEPFQSGRPPALRAGRDPHQKATGITTVVVTHDQEEAMSISDLIVVMNGVVQQIGKPQAFVLRESFLWQISSTPPINVSLTVR